jgi:hypothetical protein
MFKEIFKSIQLYSIDWTFAHLLKHIRMTLQMLFYVKIKFNQGWWMTPKMQKSFSKIKTAQMNVLAAEDINQSNMSDS